MKKFKKGERVITENGQGKVAYDQQGKYLQVKLTASGETDKYHEGTVRHDSVHNTGNLSVSIPHMHGLHTK